MSLSENTGQLKTPFDGLKWFVVWILVAAIAGANYYFADQATAIKILWSLVAFIATLTLASFTSKGKRFWGFAKDARIELRKVVWPTRQETMQATLMVVVVVILMSLLLWGVDSLLLWGVRFITG